MRPSYFPVRDTSELQRILALPRREYDPAEAAALAEVWSPELLNDAGKAEWNRCALLDFEAREKELTRLGIRLRPEQAHMLRDLTLGGLIGLAPVGIGKTLVLYLSVHIACRWFGVKRPVIMVPANILLKTQRDFSALARYWVAPSTPAQVITYSALSRPDASELLFEMKPDFLAGDESDMLRNVKATTTRRVLRYGAKNLSTCNFVFVTGTGQRHKIAHLAHLSALALKLRSPYPSGYVDLTEWGEALDAKVSFRRPPGALSVFSGGSEDLDDLREGFADWVEHTPGFCIFEKHSTDQPLRIEVIAPPDDPVIQAAFLEFRRTEETPDGWACSDVFSRMRFDDELGCGFYKRWDPRPPERWVNTRNDEARFIRDKIKATAHSRNPLDSDARVRRAFPQHEIVRTWKEVKPTFKPNSVAVPISGSTAAFVVDWMRKHGPCLVVVTHTWLGQTISCMAGCGYYASKGRTAAGSYIGDLDPACSAVISANANRRGRNLQAWHRMLIVGVEHSAERNEQILGRIHRQGQKRPCTATYLLTSAGSIMALAAACSEARHVKQMTKLPQKLLDATWDWRVREDCLSPDIDSPNRAQWFVPDN